MRRLLPAALSVLFILPGCATFQLVPPVVAPTVTTAPSAPVVTVPRPARVEDLAAGIVEALGRGDTAQARMYYLSDEEFDALFSWTGPDPRPERNALLQTALQAAGPSLAGATFKGLAGTPPKPVEFAPGRPIGKLVVKAPTSALDAVSVVTTAGGQERFIRLEGPIRVGNYWRLFSPTLEVR